MFDGSEFLEVARGLAGEEGVTSTVEAAYRTAIGRTYYACFHTLRARLCDPRGWHRQGKGGKMKYLTHRQLRGLVAKNMAPTTSDLLDTLIELREHADYHSWRPTPGALGPPPHCRCGSWQDDIVDTYELALETAQEILSR